MVSGVCCSKILLYNKDKGKFYCGPIEPLFEPIFLLTIFFDLTDYGFCVIPSFLLYPIVLWVPDGCPDSTDILDAPAIAWFTELLPPII